MSLSHAEVVAELVQTAVDYGHDNGMTNGEIWDVLVQFDPDNQDSEVPNAKQPEGD